MLRKTETVEQSTEKIPFLCFTYFDDETPNRAPTLEGQRPEVPRVIYQTADYINGKLGPVAGFVRLTPDREAKVLDLIWELIADQEIESFESQDEEEKALSGLTVDAELAVRSK